MKSNVLRESTATVLALAAWLTAACSTVDSSVGAGTSKGAVQGDPCDAVGSTAAAADGCNTCSCSSNGTWACSEIDCELPCREGDTQPAGDGCNTCSCTADGQWACTLMACLCQPGTVKQADDGCNTCSCQPDGTWACTEMACAP